MKKLKQLLKKLFLKVNNQPVKNGIIEPPKPWSRI